jgi:8-hydroxy-5-deazaflavin:NADPH oxidoreductase
VGNKATVATFAAAAAQAEIVINATHGMASLAALPTAGAENLQGKILIDVANELDFSQGMPPKSLAADTTSLGEKIQAAFPNTKVVKTLNTMNCAVMVNQHYQPLTHPSTCQFSVRILPFFRRS